MFSKKWFLALAALAVTLSCWLVCSGFVSPVLAAESPEEIVISAESASLLCVETKQTLYEKDGDTRRAMASTTKIMTSLLALEAADRNDRLIPITAEMVAVEGSSMHLRAGDVISLSGLAKGMLTVSGNDAANAAAIAVAGSAEQFAVLMNERAEKLGMENTHFVTPSGLDDEAHYSTSNDMAKLGAAAIQNESFRKICSESSVEVSFHKPEKTVMLENHNRLLRQYDGCIGIKTGFTKKAGRCLVSAAERDGVTLVCVTLSAPDDWNDHKKLLDYGFSNVENRQIGDDLSVSVPVVGGEKTTVTVIGQSNSLVCFRDEAFSCEIDLPKFLYAPVALGETIGKAQYKTKDGRIVSVPLTAAETVPAKKTESKILGRIGRWFVLLFS